MTILIKPLKTILAVLRKERVCVKKTNNRILIDMSDEKINVKKIKPIIYYLLNNFEQRYFIIIQGLPYCLMPEAAHHMQHIKQKNRKYFKKLSCKNCKYDLFCPGISKIRHKGIEIFPKYIADLPEEVVFEITQKCNLNCPLCFRSKKSKELSSSKIKKMVDDCLRLGIKDIRFTGGEPLLYKDLAIVLGYAKSKGAYVTLNTNATLINQDNLKMLKKYVDNVLISVQGFDPDSENRLVCGNIDFRQKLNNIVKLKQTIPLTRVGTIISQTLCCKFNKYLKIIKKLGIKHWELYRPMSNLSIDEFKISRVQFLKLFILIREAQLKTDINIKIINPFPFCFANNFKLSEQVLFGAYKDDGHSRLVLNHKGFRPSYPIVKYLGQNIEKSWKSPFLKKIRSLVYLPPQCKKCFYLLWCRGGSRYWAKASQDNYFSHDPLMACDNLPSK